MRVGLVGQSVHIVRGLVIACAGSAMVVSACASDPKEPDQLVTTQDPVCVNPEGANGVLAAIAVSTATELHRWQTTTDFMVSVGKHGQQRLRLTTAGLTQCTNGCINTRALLDLQDFDTQIRFDDVNVDPFALSSRLVSGWNLQKNCDTRANNGLPDDCSAEAHKLTLLATIPGISCADDSIFTATALNGQPLAQPVLLKNKLLTFHGGTINPFIAFKSTNTTVTVDPLAYLVGNTSSGSAASCTKASTVYSPNNALLNTCCQDDTGFGLFALLSPSSPFWLVCKKKTCSSVAECDDGKACTTDSCSAGYCVNMPTASCAPLPPACDGGVCADASAPPPGSSTSSGAPPGAGGTTSGGGGAAGPGSSGAGSSGAGSAGSSGAGSSAAPANGGGGGDSGSCALGRNHGSIASGLPIALALLLRRRRASASPR